jgi:hypothetical protein
MTLLRRVKLSTMPSSETFNLEQTDLRITIVRQFPLARQTADELSSWATGASTWRRFRRCGHCSSQSRAR